MNTRRVSSTNTTILYFIALVVIVVAFVLLGGGPWLRGMMHGGGPMNTASWNWTQIIISLVIGFLIGWFVTRRK